MKKSFLIIALLAATSSISFAAILTVSNYAPSPGQYSSILPAINAAVDGDTIYIQGSPTQYSGGAGLAKRLTFIGAGINPQKANAFATHLVNSEISISSSGAFGSSFIGLTFDNVGSQGLIKFLTPGNQNITFSRCYFTGNGGQYPILSFQASPVSGVNVSECIFYNATAVSASCVLVSGLMMSNCVFKCMNEASGSYELFYGYSPFCGPHVALNWSINNCIFYGYNNGSNSQSSIISCPMSQSITYNNCVFNKVYTGCMQNSTFNNCLTFGCNVDNIWQINSNFDNGFNLSGANPQFVNSGSINSGNLSLAPDGFGFTPTSPALLANHVGAPAEIGVYGGGIFNYANANASQLPFVYSLNIPTPNIQSGQNLQIDVIGKKHN